LVSRSAGSLTPADVRRADIVFLAGVPDLNEAVLESLEGQVRSGAGLVIFLGRGLNPTFYNQKLFKALKPAQGLLPVPLKTDPESLKSGNPGQLTGIHWSHPLLSPLRDPLVGDLSLCRFRRFAPFAEPIREGDAVLARIDDDEPALVERTLGAGRVLIVNTSADDAWGDLPRRHNSFVPLLDRMLGYLSAGGVRKQFTAGGPVTLPLDEWQPGEEVAVVDPGGNPLKPRLLTAAGRTFLHFETIGSAGIYRVERPGKSAVPFAVNVSRDGSALTPMDAKVLAEWWQPANVEMLSQDQATERYASDSAGWPLGPLLVLAGCLLLLVETVYVYRLCPRLNPSAAASVVPQRGLLRPLTQAAEVQRP
jgi:hypothetical protein